MDDISEQQPEQLVPLTIGVIITEKNDAPQLELRKSTGDAQAIRLILSCAFHERPIILQPIFKDKIKAIGSLLDKGVIYKERNDYIFNI